VEGAAAAQGQLLGMGQAADATEARFRSLAVIGSGLLVGALVVVAGASVKMAADFQQAVNRLRTGAGDTQDSFNTLAGGILKVSVATGLMSGPLTKAMYEILSSGQRGAQAFDTLAAAAKGAVIEQANVVDVSDTLAGAMTNFGTKTFGAVAYMNGLITAVSRGRITLQDLSTAMGPIEPVAHAMGISFADLSAAMSTQTNAAIPAARAATGLRFMMQALEVPTTKAKDAMAAMGLSSVKVAEEMKVSLPGALQMIYDAAKKAGPEGSVPFNRAVSDMVGGQRSLSAFLALTGGHMKDFEANARAIAASMKGGTGDVNGWAIAQSNFNVQMDRAKASVEAAMIVLGSALLPVLTRLVLIPILAGLGAVIAVVLVPAIWAFAAGVIAATWPALAIGAAIAALTALFMHLYGTNAGFKAFIDNLSRGFQQVAGYVAANFMPTLQALIAWISGTMIPTLATWAQWLYVNVGGAFSALGTFATNARSAVGGFFSTVGSMANTARMDIGNFFSMIGTVAHNALVTLQNFGTWLAGVFTPDFKDLTGTTGQIGAAFSGLGSALQNLWQTIKPLGGVFSQLGEQMHQLGGLIASQYGPAFSALGTVMNQLGKAVLPALKIAWDAIVQAIQPILPGLKLVAQIIGGVVVAALVLLISLLAGLVMAFAQVLVGITKIFVGIVGVVTGAIHVIIGIVTFLIDLLTGHFSKLGTDLGVIWNGIKTMLQGVWSIIQGIFQASIGAIASLLGTFVHTAITIFQGLANALVGHSIIPDMINAIIAWFASLPGRALSAVGNLAGMLAGFFGGLAGRAFGWGWNIINNLAGGIINGIWSALGGAMDAVGNFIRSHLPFSPAKRGPLKDLALAGSKIPEQIALGMVTGMPKLQASLNMMLAPMTLAPRLSTSGGAYGSPQIIVQPPDIYLDGVRLSRGLMPYIANGIRYNTGGFGR